MREQGRHPLAGVGEAVAVGAAGGALGGFALDQVDLATVGIAVGALNGALGGWRATYDWRRPKGYVAFVLDSTWAIVLTAAALVTHAVAAVQRDRGTYLAELSTRANRHVYARGFRLRPGFLVTIGNAIHGAGAHALTSARRRRVVTDHEDVHVWQGRWLGPLFPVLYLVWLVVGGGCGAGVWLARGRRESLPKVVETCAYYVNPFEWWAYSRDGNWPPKGKVPGIGWNEPLVRPLSEVRSRRPRRAPPVPPAVPR